MLYPVASFNFKANIQGKGKTMDFTITLSEEQWSEIISLLNLVDYLSFSPMNKRDAKIYEGLLVQEITQ